VRDRFESYFWKKNTILGRVKFSQRKQEEESVDNFILDLYRLSEHCGYVLCKEMIRDHIVVGL